MQLGVIGCGKMATALVGGAIKAGALETEQVVGYDPFPAEHFKETTGCRISGSLAGLAECETLLLATKPQQAEAALAELRKHATAGGLLISIAAGLSCEWLGARVHEGFRVVRCMPNTPALVGKGAAGYSRGGGATDEDAAFTGRLLGAIGIAIEFPESLLDAVTGLSGSGPAYVFLAIEALADGGVKNGLPRADALRLAAQTVLGAAAMVLELGRHPAELKDMVASPGGTTIAGLAALERGGARAALIEAVTAASLRSAELGRG